MHPASFLWVAVRRENAVTDLALYMNCLVLVQTFETFWAYYAQSEGKLYSRECREAALAFTESFFALQKEDNALCQIISLSNSESIEEHISDLEVWAFTDTR